MFFRFFESFLLFLNTGATSPDFKSSGNVDSEMH